MTNYFIITSAFNVGYGIFNVQQRFAQTLRTIDTIKNYCNNSSVVVLETSPNPVTSEQHELLVKYGAKLVVDFSSEMVIQYMHKELNLVQIKSPSELYCIGSFLKRQDFITENDRLFKISGRYFLNRTFDTLVHSKSVGKFVMANPIPGIDYFDESLYKRYPKLTPFQHRLRLYSLCGSLVGYFSDKCFEMFEFYKDIHGRYFTDIEHVMYKFIDIEKINFVENIGVSGIFADRNEYVRE
jgi:hypothetical protein